MKIRHKCAIAVVIIFILNTVLFAAVYNHLLSPRVSNEFTTTQSELDAVTLQTAKDISTLDDVIDFSVYLSGMQKSYQNNNTQSGRMLGVSVRDSNNSVIFELPVPKRPQLNFSSSAMFQHHGTPYMLVLYEAYPIDNVIKIQPAKYVLGAEILIILFLLLLTTFVIYRTHIRRIESLKNMVDAYKNGTIPQESKVHDELGELQNSFVSMARENREEKQKQARMIASISHDIKTPLTSIMGYTQRLEKSQLTEEKRSKYYRTIHDKSLAIRDLVREFDDYLSCHIENNLQKKPCTVKEVCEIIASDYKYELDDMKISFSVNDTCPETKIAVDISKFRRIFGNIIDNSLKFRKADQPCIICLTVSRLDCTVDFAVSDNGSGVSPENLEQIFEPLYTSDGGRSVCGLGLAICSEITKAHDGKIWAENNTKDGLTVHVVIPVLK